jgi:OOP family OmpA-OmpF porin
MKKIRVSILSFAFMGTVLCVGNAKGKEVFGESYIPYLAQSDIVSNQARIVFYRPFSETYPNATHVYVDGEFQTALLAGGYSEFCLTPGVHSLGSFSGDEPLYNGKRKQEWDLKFNGGETYYFRPANIVTGQPESIAMDIAEKQLGKMHRQMHALSRASKVQACQWREKKYKDYILPGDILFNFGRYSKSDISFEGEKAVLSLLATLNKDNARLKSIEVIGYTDPIGSIESNYILGQRRARTVMEMLKDGGVLTDNLTAKSGGSSEPLITDCIGTKAYKIACYAPNRRVVVRVTSHKE